MSQGFTYLVIMHNFSLIEYIASGEEEAVTNYMTDIELCQKSPDEDNIGRYYCVYFDQDRNWGLLLKVILHYVLYSSKGTFKSKHEVSGYYFSDIEIKSFLFRFRYFRMMKTLQ